MYNFVILFAAAYCSKGGKVNNQQTASTEIAITHTPPTALRQTEGGQHMNMFVADVVKCKLQVEVVGNDGDGVLVACTVWWFNCGCFCVVRLLVQWCVRRLVRAVGISSNSNSAVSGRRALSFAPTALLTTRGTLNPAMPNNCCFYATCLCCCVSRHSRRVSAGARPALSRSAVGS